MRRRLQNNTSFGESKRLVTFAVAVVILAWGVFLCGNRAWLWIEERHTRGIFMVTGRIRAEVQNRDSLKRVETLILGDSTALMTIVPGEISDPAKPGSVRSFAFHVAGAAESLSIYRQAKRNGLQPKCVVLMYSYGGYKYHLELDHWWLLAHSGVLSFDEKEEIRRISEEKRVPPGHSISRSLFMLKAGVLSFVYGGLPLGFVRERLLNPIWRERTKRDQKYYDESYGWYPLFRPDVRTFPVQDQTVWSRHLENTFQTQPMFDHYYRELVEEIVRDGSKVALMFGPLAQSLRTPNTEAWFGAYRSHILSLAGLNELGEGRHEISDQLELEFRPDDHFVDPSHLYYRNAWEWSAENVERIRTCGGLLVL
jgi:hypothetical protein